MENTISGETSISSATRPLAHSRVRSLAEALRESVDYITPGSYRVCDAICAHKRRGNFGRYVREDEKAKSVRGRAAPNREIRRLYYVSLDGTRFV